MDDGLIYIPEFLGDNTDYMVYGSPRCLCNNCMSTCEVYCEVGCEICESCQGSYCESGCQESCQVSCMCSNQGGQCWNCEGNEGGSGGDGDGGGGSGGCQHEWITYHGVNDCKDEKGHEWYKKCKKCKVEELMGVYKPGVIKWNYDAFSKEKCKQWGDCTFVDSSGKPCGKRYYKYPYHIMVGNRCVNCGYTDMVFEWDTPKYSGREVNITASEWNKLQQFINDKRKLLGYQSWNFTRVVTGRRMRADEYNDVRQSISGMGGQNLPPKMMSGDKMIADHLNMLVDSINDIN